jgi:hypothetical protein
MKKQLTKKQNIHPAPGRLLKTKKAQFFLKSQRKLFCDEILEEEM